MKPRRFGTAVSLLMLCTQCSAMAQGGLDLDLSSSNAGIKVTDRMLRGATAQTITVGGQQKTVTSGSMITAGEYSALRQVAANHAQGLILDATGVATGGQARIGSNFNNVVIPENVTLVANAARGVNVTNNLTANGILFGQSPIATTFNVNAGNVFIGSAGSITTMTPTALQGLVQQAAAVNLNIVSAGNIINQGAVTSSGNLSMTAGGSITNALQSTVAQTIQQSLPTISAQNNVSITSAIGDIVNSGLISSLTSNVTLNSIGATNLIVNNVGGVIAAQQGSINVRDSLFTAKELTTLTGGNFVSQSLEVFGGDGLASIDVNQITGVVNLSAGKAHLSANTADLNIGTFALTGDPSIVNTGGDITLHPNDTTSFPFPDTLRFSGEHLAVIASGSIYGDPNLYLIDTGSSTGDGGDITLLAGFDAIKISGTKWDVTGPSLTGGSVYLPQVSLRSSASGPNGTAGDITAAAHGGYVVLNAAVADGGQPGAGVAGTAGAIKIYGQQGVAIGGPVEAVGLSRDGDIRIGAFDPIEVGDLTFQNGKPVGGSIGAQFTDDIAPIYLYGNVSALSKPDNGGFVTIAGTGDVNLAPGINITSSNILEILSGTNIIAAGNNGFGASTDILLQLTDYTSYGRGPGNINLGPGTIFQSGLSTTIDNEYGNISLGGNSYISSGYRTVIVGYGDVTVADSAPGGGLIYGFDQVRMMSQSGTLSIGSNNPIAANIAVAMFAGKLIDIADNSPIYVGALAPGAPTSGNLKLQDVALPGVALLISEGSIKLGSDINTIGENILVGAFGLNDDGIGTKASTGNIYLGDGTSFIGNGGYVTMYANGNLTGTNNTFNSTAWGDENNFTGGLVQLAAGFAFSPDVIAILPTDIHNSDQLLNLETPILKTSDKITGYSGIDVFGFQVVDPKNDLTNLKINGNGMEPGLVQADRIGGGTINVNGIADLQRGAIFIDSVGGGHTVNLQNAKFGVTSYDLLPTAFGAADLLGVTQDFFSRLRGDGTRPEEAALVLSRVNLPPDFVVPDFKLSSTVSALDEQRLYIDFIMGKRNSSDQDQGSAGDTTIGNGTLLGQVSMSSNSSFASMFSNYGIVDTGKTEPSGGGRAFSMVSPDGMPSGVFGSLSPGMNGQNNANLPAIRVDQRQPDLMLFTTANQVVRGDMVNSPGAIAVGSEGTAISTEDGKMLLHTGSVVADTQDKPMTVVTSAARVEVDKNSTAVVVVAPGKGVRVVALSSRDSNAIKIRPHGGGPEQLVTLAPGEQIVIAEPPAQDNQNQAGNQAVNAASPDRGMYYACKSSVNVANFTATELSGFSTASIRLSGTRSDYLRMMSRLKEVQGTVASAITKPAVLQVAEPAKFIASDGSLLHQEADGAVTIVNGSMFMMGMKPEKLRTEFGDVQVDSNSLLSVDANAGRVRVRACSGPDDVNVKVGKSQIALGPGQEVLLADGRPTKKEALGSDGIGRRKLEVHQLDDAQWSVLGDFSIASVLSGQGNLDKLKTLKEKQPDVYARLMKMAACVEMSTPAHGRYFAAPKEAAMKNVPDEVFTIAKQ